MFFIAPMKLELSENFLYSGTDFLEGSVCAHKKYPSNFNIPENRVDWHYTTNYQNAKVTLKIAGQL